jgi:hypothetical protein
MPSLSSVPDRFGEGRWLPPRPRSGVGCATVIRAGCFRAARQFAPPSTGGFLCPYGRRRNHEKPPQRTGASAASVLVLDEKHWPGLGTALICTDRVGIIVGTRSNWPDRRLFRPTPTRACGRSRDGARSGPEFSDDLVRALAVTLTLGIAGSAPRAYPIIPSVPYIPAYYLAPASHYHVPVSPDCGAQRGAKHRPLAFGCGRMLGYPGAFRHRYDRPKIIAASLAYPRRGTPDQPFGSWGPPL